MKLHVIIYLSLLLFLGSGCSDFLDVQPKDKQSEEQLFATRGGFYTAVNGIYNKLASSSLYGKNLTFKTGGVDGCDCEETLKLIAEGKIDTEPLITHTYPLSRIEEAYELFENKRDGVIKVAVEC